MFTPNLAAFFTLLASTAAAVSFDISHIAIWYNATEPRSEISFTVARTQETSHGDGHGPHKCRIELKEAGADNSCYSTCDDTEPATFYTRIAPPNFTDNGNASVEVLEFHRGPVELGKDKGILNNATFDFPEAREEDNCEGEDENFFACLFDDVFRVEAVEMNPAIRPQNVCK